MTTMEPPPKPNTALFQVYLRLRPPPVPNLLYPVLAPPECFLSVEPIAEGKNAPTHIVLNPPNDNRKRAVEKFGFTEVFEEEASQLDIFHGAGVVPLVEGVIAKHGGEGRDGLLATLGVTGSGKSHTILGSKSSRGLTQMSLDLLFRSLSNNIVDPSTNAAGHISVASADTSEAQVLSAQGFFDLIYNDTPSVPTHSRTNSRAATPMSARVPPTVSSHTPSHSSTLLLLPGSFPHSFSQSPSASPTREMAEVSYPPLPPSGRTDPFRSPRSIQVVNEEPYSPSPKGVPKRRSPPKAKPSYMQTTRTFLTKLTGSTSKIPFLGTNEKTQDSAQPPNKRLPLPRVGAMPTAPNIDDVICDADPGAEYAVLVSMYEVYNDRIFDLLTPSTGKSNSRRRPLLFKPTEQSPERKVVAGLRKVVCANMSEALLVLDAGLHERRVAGTGSNSVSSRSHGFFCVEVKKRRRAVRERREGSWRGSALTIVDLAGSERARDARTAGATLAEAGKINESLMYLGQCLQMQSDIESGVRGASAKMVPYRQCKLTELLFSNSFPKDGVARPQRATMIVTADPVGDFNATSQILRYSALAREITVPRIPSITASIHSVSSVASQNAAHTLRGMYSGSTLARSNSVSSSASASTERETLDLAAQEIAKLQEEIEALQSDIFHEHESRLEAEQTILNLQEQLFEAQAHNESVEERMEERMVELEQAVREEVVQEMEKRMESEVRRWKLRWEEEREWNGEHMDRKIEILARGLEDNKENDSSNRSTPGKAASKVIELEEENRALRQLIQKLQRGDIGGRSPGQAKLQPTPSMQLPIREQREALRETSYNLAQKMNSFSLNTPSPNSTPIPSLRSPAPLLGAPELRSPTRTERARMPLQSGFGGSLRGEELKPSPMQTPRANRLSPKKSGSRLPLMSGEVSPVKKVRKLGTRKWDVEGDELL